MSNPSEVAALATGEEATHFPKGTARRGEIDYVVENKGARPVYGDEDTAGDDLLLLGDGRCDATIGLVAVVAYATVSAIARFIASCACTRVSFVLSVQCELQKDGRLPGDSALRSEEGNDVRQAAVHPPRGPTMRTFSCIRYLSHNGGARWDTFLRGAKLNFVLSAAALGCEMAVVRWMSRVRGALRMRRGVSAGAARQCWAVAAPLALWLSLWPLKAFRNVMLVNYAGDVRSSTRQEDATAALGELPALSSDSVPAVPEYRFRSYAALWQEVRDTMGWRAVLWCGLDVALINCITALGVARLIEPVVQGLLLCAQVPSDERTFRPTTVIIALNGVLTAVNVIHRPFIVMKERMAVLPLSTGLPGGSHGRRYASMGACARAIYTEEGLRGFFVGLEFCLVMNVLLPLLQTLALGTVHLPHVDTGLA